jgi:hypothetical protein
VLREKKNTGLRLLGGSAISKPYRQRHAGSVLGRDAAHVENNRAKSTSL